MERKTQTTIFPTSEQVIQWIDTVCNDSRALTRMDNITVGLPPSYRILQVVKSAIKLKLIEVENERT